MNYIIFHSSFWIAAKTCDGVVHCIEGEDEADETCKGQLDFPEEATIVCYENRPSLDYNITIRAVPCNNITECRDGKDEDGCKANELKLLGIVLLVLTTVTNGLYHYMKWVYLDWKNKITRRKSTVHGWNPKNCQKYKGNDLANLKVRMKSKIIFGIIICFMYGIDFRIQHLKLNVQNYWMAMVVLVK